MRLHLAPAHDPAVNLALEEILTREGSAPLFLLWRNAPSIVIGRNQNPDNELDWAFVRKKNITIVRRITGGGAVYHDLGNLNYSCVVESGAHTDFRDLAQPILRALGALGIAAEFSGRNDLLCGGRKFSGSARSLCGPRVLFHGTLLFDTDLSVLARALTPDPEKLRVKGISSVRSRVMNLKECLPDWSTEDFMREFAVALERELKTQRTEISAEHLRAAERLAAEKYRTAAWLLGGFPRGGVTSKVRTGGGFATLICELRGGRIVRARLSGDFFGERPVSELENALCGCASREEALSAWRALPVEKYIAGATHEELAPLVPCLGEIPRPAEQAAPPQSYFSSSPESETPVAKRTVKI